MTLPEPPDGHVVVTKKRGEYLVWTRDDAWARCVDKHVLNWFTMNGSYAQTWDNVIEGANVYFLKPAMINGKVVR